ncbi:NAD(P)H-binding protein [candidate division KSB1 bacterium]|nr:NAD(P)H-binding protein [candidate division KSB1 bacterium]
MRVAVVGATGNFGRPVAFRLLEAGHKVRVLTRSAGNARARCGDRVEYAELDLLSLDDAIAALSSCQAVHLNLNLDRISSADAAVWSGYRNIVAAARVNHVARISSIVGDPPLDPARDFLCDAALFGGSKLIADSGVPFTLFYPSWFMEGIRWFSEDGRALVPGHQRHRYHWLAATDYADRVVRALEMPDCANRQLWIHGPAALSIPEALSVWCSSHLPGVAVEELPIARLRNRNLNDVFYQRYLDLMAAMEVTGEIGDPTAANALFGPPRTTLREFIGSHVH